MKYEKALAEVVKFDFTEFMAGSLTNGHCKDYSPDSLRHCGDYYVGISCSNWTSSGATCVTYNGSNCTTYIYNGHEYSNQPWNCSHF